MPDYVRLSLLHEDPAAFFGEAARPFCWVGVLESQPGLEVGMCAGRLRGFE
jgi:hypothetical protein